MSPYPVLIPKSPPDRPFSTSRGATRFITVSAQTTLRTVRTCVVHTAAIHPDNPEYKAAVEKGIPMMTRADLWASS
ncbi:MAG: Mur ligase domain-containing protein [Lachnospiraceae bacterium]